MTKQSNFVILNNFRACSGCMAGEVQSFPCSSSHIFNDSAFLRKGDIEQWKLPDKASFKWKDSKKLYAQVLTVYFLYIVAWWWGICDVQLFKMSQNWHDIWFDSL